MRVFGYQEFYEGIECVSYPPDTLLKAKEHLERVSHATFPETKGFSLNAINDMLTHDDIVYIFSISLWTINGN